jgi:hypothetical protein
MVLEAVKVVSLVTVMHWLTCVEEPHEAAGPDSPTYVPVSDDWVPPDGYQILPCLLLPPHLNQGDLAPTHEATNDGLEYGPIDKLSFKVQGMLLLDEAE